MLNHAPGRDGMSRLAPQGALTKKLRGRAFQAQRTTGAKGKSGLHVQSTKVQRTDSVRLECRVRGKAEHRARLVRWGEKPSNKTRQWSESNGKLEGPRSVPEMEAKTRVSRKRTRSAGSLCLEGLS